MKRLRLVHELVLALIGYACSQIIFVLHRRLIVDLISLMFM